MRVLVFWEPLGLTVERANPYAGLLARGLEPLGVECAAGFRENLTPEWMAAHAAEFDILHLHWPWGQYFCDTLEETAARAGEMLESLAVARARGARIVWTMHNLYPHDSATPSIDHLMRLAIVQASSAVIVHCEHARRLLAARFHREHGVFTIPHGHFDGPYPNLVGTAEARARFGFAEGEFVFLLFGTVRRNKGFEQCLEAFRDLPDGRLRLLFAARVCSEYGRSMVDAAGRADGRLVFYETERFANEEFQFFYNAADAAVFPFTDILTSGSAITSLSFRCPVIVPAMGCLPELVDESVGLTYDPQAPGALREAMRRAAGMRRDDFRPGIERRLAELNWDGIARKTLEAYLH
jgi:glycosyltransferase involved in cell wall biosynthesis